VVDHDQPGPGGQPGQDRRGYRLPAAGWQRDGSDPERRAGRAGELPELSQHRRVAMVRRQDLVSGRQPGTGDHRLHAGGRVVHEGDAVLVGPQELGHLRPYPGEQAGQFMDQETVRVALERVPPGLLVRAHAHGRCAEPAVIEVGKGRIKCPRGRVRKFRCHNHANRMLTPVRDRGRGQEQGR
jgi:hypothetical protein